MSDDARTEAVKPEWLKAWRVLREGRLRDLDSNDPGWPSGVEMFVVGFNAGASRKVEVTPAEFGAAIGIERSRQIEKGYDVAHDDQHGAQHLINWAIDYARRGENVKVGAMLLALSELFHRQASRKVEVTDTLTEEVLAMLDDLNASNGIAYDDYVRLHDAISRKVEVTANAHEAVLAVRDSLIADGGRADAAVYATLEYLSTALGGGE